MPYYPKIYTEEILRRGKEEGCEVYKVGYLVEHNTSMLFSRDVSSFILEEAQILKSRLVPTLFSWRSFGYGGAM